MNRKHVVASTGAFTLVELLAVMAIVIIMVSLMVPAIKGLAGTTGRRGALNILLATFDQARVAALQSGTDVSIAFADATFPNPEKRYRSLIVFRKRLESDEPPEGTTGVSQYVFLTGWKDLPQGVSLKSENSSLVGDTDGKISIVPEDGFPSVTSGTLPAITFNSTGGVARPVDAAKLQLFVYEGFHEGGRDILTSQGGGLFDLVSISRFTGRARLEVSTL